MVSACPPLRVWCFLFSDSSSCLEALKLSTERIKKENPNALCRETRKQGPKGTILGSREFFKMKRLEGAWGGGSVAAELTHEESGSVESSAKVLGRLWGFRSQRLLGLMWGGGT